MGAGELFWPVALNFLWVQERESQTMKAMHFLSRKIFKKFKSTSTQPQFQRVHKSSVISKINKCSFKGYSMGLVTKINGIWPYTKVSIEVYKVSAIFILWTHSSCSSSIPSTQWWFLSGLPRQCGYTFIYLLTSLTIIQVRCRFNRVVEPKTFYACRLSLTLLHNSYSSAFELILFLLHSTNPSQTAPKPASQEKLART